ncbi:M48 family metalloprotease [Kineococcus rubinsiae]|uniref:M48 family metalloprotease n=1 Tax=Kineococcus rubinsiae TaxID=2609562 RepID=UPI0014310ACB|nr:M48 family metalloprotease [Kineococcus rubinsiae]NIZ89667.1 hypothetical protein [Kineococcus rubinsiae]
MFIYVTDALDVLVPLALAWTALLALLGPRLAASVSPGRAVRLLSAAATGATLAAGAAVVAVVCVLLARVPDIAAWGRWARGALPEPGLTWHWALPLAVVALVSVLAGARHLLVVLHQLRLAQDVCRTPADPPATRTGAPAETRETAGGPVDAEWLVVEEARPEAYAVPSGLRLPAGWPWARRRRGGSAPAGQRGRIVVSQGMLDVLTPAQQCVLLEHERAHLRHRHYLWIQLSEVAAVLNPALRRIPPLVRSAAERQADLCAVARVGDATLTAQAIAAAALARTGARRPPTAVAGALQATGGDVVSRVEHLLRPAPARSDRVGALALGLVVVLSTLTSAGTLYSVTARLLHAQDRVVSLGAPPAQVP